MPTTPVRTIAADTIDVAKEQRALGLPTQLLLNLGLRITRKHPENKHLMLLRPSSISVNLGRGLVPRSGCSRAGSPRTMTNQRCRLPQQNHHHRRSHHHHKYSLQRVALRVRWKSSSSSSSCGSAVEGSNMKEWAGFGLAGAAASFTGTYLRASTALPPLAGRSQDIVECFMHCY